MSTPTYMILAFCGGGIRGLASVTMLNKLCASHPNIVTGADMLAGTSTGAGIIASLANGKKPSDLITYFKTDEVFFFSNNKFNPNGLSSQPQYDVQKFATRMGDKYGQQTLAGIKELKKPYDVLMTSFNVGAALTNAAWQPILYHNLKGSTNSGTLVADAVVSSGAMPGMFGSYGGNVDGAFVNHDPTLAAIALAVQSGVSLENIAVICFGTGFMMNALGNATSGWGAQQWQQGDPDSASVMSPLLINGSISPITNISLNGTSTNLIPMLAGMMLPGRYAYLNPPLSYFIPENDTNFADLEYLQSQSENADLVNYAAADVVLTNFWPPIRQSAAS